jgi:hypothetical protein
MSEALNLKLCKAWSCSRRVLRIGAWRSGDNGPTINELEERICRDAAKYR